MSYFFRGASTVLIISNDYRITLVNVNYTTLLISVIHIGFNGIQTEI